MLTSFKSQINMKTKTNKQKLTSKFLLRTLLTLIAVIAFETSSMGAARFAVSTGNWSGSIWASTVGGTAGTAATPTSSDAVTINPGVTVTLTGSAACASLTVGDASTNSAAQLSVVAQTLTVSGNVVLVLPTLQTVTVPPL